MTIVGLDATMGQGCGQGDSSRATETDQAYARLREAIVGERLLPNERLLEADLAQGLGVGRAAIRTALARLEQDGLVERESFRGARVRAISDAEAVGNLEARAVLDGLAVRHAAGNATGADAARLRATLAQTRRTFRAGDLPEMFELKAHLNRQVLGIASHRTATRLVDALQAQSVRSQYRTVLVPGRAEQSLAEHRAIVAAVEAGRADEAEERMRAHLSRVVGALRQAQRSRQAARSSV